MREKSVEVSEPEQKEALDRTERSNFQRGLPGRREMGPPESPARGARGIVEPGRHKGPLGRRLVEPGGSDNKRQNTTLSRHATKCRICNHPDRHAIEFDFLNWRNPGDLARAYNLRDLTTIYRHAHATGLFSKRRLNLRFALERIVERVAEVPVTATSVIRAARAVSRINDSGEWVDPPSRLIVTHLNSEEAPQPKPRKPSKIEVTAKPQQAPIFDSVLLDELSESATASGELPMVNGKPPEPEVILTITPEFARCREERQRAIEADLAARAANAATETQSMAPLTSSLPEATVENSAQLASRSSHRDASSALPPHAESKGFVGRGFNRDINAGSSSSSLLPQAAVGYSAPSALPHPAAPENNVADNKENVASPSSALPEAAPDKPAIASQSPRAVGPALGSSGSADPQFPFTPEPLRRWKPRRRF